MVNHPEDPDEGQNGLDNTKDAGGEQAGVGTADAEGVEDSRAVVVDGVDAGTVLPEKKPCGAKLAWCSKHPKDSRSLHTMPPRKNRHWIFFCFRDLKGLKKPAPTSRLYFSRSSSM